ncbi:MAG: hypothetical protein HRU00_11910, partial [Myxococcales bacterium]|nr:hypothetical protein [Myxococcales bacterium]
LAAELIRLVRDGIGPVAAFKQTAVVTRLPKTRSGKILRGTMRKIADAQPYSVPATIDDPESLDEVRQALEQLGFGASAPQPAPREQRPESEPEPPAADDAGSEPGPSSEEG